ncbi:MAG TPA: hypothetical protein VGM50_09900 [Gemmatimonadaceae bacterium]|jgi:hypothetical protein
MRAFSALLLAFTLITSVAAAQDTTLAGVQRRGKAAMGVDQKTSTHKFDLYPNGGRIELQRDTDDPQGIATIRAHIRDIAKAFKSGDFSTPEFVHMREVPGTKVMTAKANAITYEVRNLPRGAELHIRTDDPVAVEAVHQFMTFQRQDHHAIGMHPE